MPVLSSYDLPMRRKTVRNVSALAIEEGTVALQLMRIAPRVRYFVSGYSRSIVADELIDPAPLKINENEALIEIRPVVACR
jgi:hypothetical protein